ncbi:MAG TPA: hypothetical protein PK375_01635, partial [Rhodocyclaceae bacterium]|nr:hypothetical protein [Rhodocyclaceae bacterium]
MIKLPWAVWAAAALTAMPATAQVTVPPAADPGALQQRQIDEERRRRDLEREPRKAGRIDWKAMNARAH